MARLSVLLASSPASPTWLHATRDQKRQCHRRSEWSPTHVRQSLLATCSQHGPSLPWWTTRTGTAHIFARTLRRIVSPESWRRVSSVNILLQCLALLPLAWKVPNLGRDCGLCQAGYSLEQQFESVHIVQQCPQMLTRAPTLAKTPSVYSSNFS